MSSQSRFFLQFFGQLNVAFENIPVAHQRYVERHFGAHVVPSPECAERTIAIRYVERVEIPETMARISGRVAVGEHDLFLAVGGYLHLFIGKAQPWKLEVPTSCGPQNMCRVMMLALHMLASSHGLAFVHSSAIAIGTKGVVFPAWSNTGKTILSHHLLKKGAVLAGDDWCALDGQGRLYPFLKSPVLYPNDLRMHPHYLRYAPKRKQLLMRAYLARCARGKFKAGQLTPLDRKINTAVEWLRKRLGVPYEILLPPKAIDTLAQAQTVDVSALYWLARCGRSSVQIEAMPLERLVRWIIASYEEEMAEFIPTVLFGASAVFQDAYKGHIERLTQILTRGLSDKKCSVCWVPMRSDSFEVWEPLLHELANDIALD